MSKCKCGCGGETNPGRDYIYQHHCKGKSSWNKNKSSWSKDKHLSEEHRKKIGVGNTGKIRTSDMKKAHSEKMKGFKHTKESKRKIGEASEGHILNKDARKKISKSKIGNKNPMYGIKKEKHPNWKGGMQVSKFKTRNKRKNLGYHILNTPFVNSEGHHISKEYVVFINKEIHKKVRHNIYTGLNMDTINFCAIQQLLPRL